MTALSPINRPRVQVAPGVWLDSLLGLWIAEPRILVVADLHWGYVMSHRAQGNLLPAWGDADITRRLDALVSDYAPSEMIWLGDSLHTLAGAQAADVFLKRATFPITIVAGNHDARWVLAKDRSSVTRANCYLHHGDRMHDVPPDALEIVGHHHPAVSWADGAGTRLKLPALIASQRRLVLPAFSPWAAGTPWKLGTEGEVVYAIGTKRIFTLPQPRTHKEACIP